MDLAVDDARQYVEPGRVIDFSSIHASQIANMRDTLADHADIGLGHTAGRNDGAAFKDQIIGHDRWGVTPEGLSQGWFFGTGKWRRSLEMGQNHTYKR